MEGKREIEPESMQPENTGEFSLVSLGRQRKKEREEIKRKKKPREWRSRCFVACFKILLPEVCKKSFSVEESLIHRSCQYYCWTPLS